MVFFSRVSWSARVALAVGVVGAVAGLSWSARVKAQAIPEMLPGGLSALEVAMYDEAARQQLSFLPNQVLVKFRDGVARAGQQRALMALRSRPAIDDVRWAGPLAVITDLGQANADILAQQLREQPEVEYAQPNYLRKLQGTPNDPSYASRQWNMTALDMPRAWDINAGGSGVTIAIVDSGVTNVNTSFSAFTWSGSAIVLISLPFAVNPDLASSRLVPGQDFTSGRGTTVLDTDGHGTHVSGTAAEDTNNGVMLAGVAYNTRIMPLKACLNYWDLQFSRSAAGIPGFQSGGGFCPDSGTAPSIRYAADNGAKVINFSIGGPGEAPAIRDALEYAAGKGTFVAISAGNEFDEGNPVSYPAKYGEDIDGVMAVAALGPNLQRSFYSSTGSYVEITAPGGDTRAGGQPGAIWQSGLRDADVDGRTVIFPRFDRYEETPLQGTSMSSPHVAGVAALIFSQLGSAATPKLVEQIIKSTARACTDTSCEATATGTRSRNDAFGVGLVQARAALFGSGLRK